MTHFVDPNSEKRQGEVVTACQKPEWAAYSSRRHVSGNSLAQVAPRTSYCGSQSSA